MSELREPLEILNCRGAMLYDSAWDGKIREEYFHEKFWENQSNTEILAAGRSTTYKVQLENVPEAWVLRNYHRGGLLGKFIKRNYVYTSEQSVRSFSEWRLLSKLYQLGLSVPKPIAAIYWRSGLTYTAALLTSYIDSSSTLSSHLIMNKAIDWEKIALTIRAIHDAGCVHGDLNAHNILLHGEEKVTIIDFDKSSFINKVGRLKTQEKNLFRLKRSLLKVTNWPEEKLEVDWKEFMHAYTSA